MKHVFLSILTAFVLVGCANIATTKHKPQGNIETVVLIPTGAFPAKKELATVYEDRAYQLMADSIKAQLPAMYRKNIVVSKRAETNVSFTDWYNTDQVNLSGLQGLKDDSLLIDYGFQAFSLVHYWETGYLVAEATIGVLFIDPKTGKVVGRAREYAVGNSNLGDAMGTNGELVAVLRDKQPVSQVPTSQIDSAFQRVTNRLTTNAIRKITDSQ